MSDNLSPGSETGRTHRLPLAVAAGVILLVAVGATVSEPTSALPAPEVVPVVSTELICPDAPTTSTGSVRTLLSAVTPSTIAGTSAGAAAIGTSSKPTALGTLSGRRFGLSRFSPPSTSAVIGRAIASRAPGFAMDQLTISSRRGDHGIAGATCTEADNDVWFVGTGSAVGHGATLYLTDPESTPATVDVALYGRNGLIDAPGGRGILVPGNSRRIVHLDRLAPAAGSLAVHVTVSSGRVAAAVLDTEVRGLLPRGADWLPFADPPATRVVVPGLGSGAGSRKLSIFAPGEGTATVRVRLVGVQGSFAPTGGAASVDVDRGRLTTVDLGNAVVSDQSAAVIESDVPVVAGVRWTLTAGSIPDLAFSAGTSALTAPAVVAGNRADNGFRTYLLVTATDGAGSVSVQPLANGVPSGPPRVVKVGASQTTRLDMPKGANRGSFQVVITPLPGSGPLYPAVLRVRKVDGSTALTLAVVRSARITVQVPAARPDLGVGLGR